MKLLSLLLLCSLPVLCQQVTGNGGGGSSSNIVSSVATGCGLTGGTITSTGTISSQELVNAQTGTTYTYLTTDCGKLVTHSNAGAIAATLPQAGSTGFAAGWWMDVEDTGTGTLTITPTTSTINGAATLVLTTKTGSRIVSDGTNYQLQTGGFANPCTGPNCYIGSGSSSSGTATALAFPVLVATNYGNGTTNSIASAITACGTSTPCTVLVPASYATTEVVPGQYWTNFGGALGPYGSPATGSLTSSNVNVVDLRFGEWLSLNNNGGANITGGTGAEQGAGIAHLQNYNYSLGTPAINDAIHLGVVEIASAYAGGINYNNSGVGGNTSNKTTYGTFWSYTNAWTPGQHLNSIFGVYNYSVGDGVANGLFVQCNGGFAAGSDEGCEWADQELFMGAVEYGGTISGSPGTGAVSVTITPTQGSRTQGVGRYIIDTTTGTISAGTITAITTSTVAPNTITGSGTGWTASAVIGTLGTAVTTYNTSQTVTPTFSTGAIAGITTSTVVCVADGASFEMVQPTAVGVSTFTAVFQNPHISTAIIAVGGLCGYGLALTADNVTNSTFTGTRTITGTLHRVMPVVSSASATSLALWVSAGGAYIALTAGSQTAWNASTANTYTLYPMSIVTDVSNGTGGVTNTLTLQPNIVAWTSGDVIAVPLYPWNHFGNGQWIMEKYQTSPGNAGSGSAITYNGIWTTQDTLLGLVNNTNPGLYSINAGAFAPPLGISITGNTSYGLYFSKAPAQSALYLGCINTTCTTSTINVVTAIGNGGSGTDTFRYNENTGQWTLSTGFNTLTVQVQNSTTRTINSPAYGINNGASWTTGSGAPSGSAGISSGSFYSRSDVSAFYGYRGSSTWAELLPYAQPPTIIYSAAGTALASCVSGLKGAMAVVSDATAPTYLATYASGGAVTATVLCNGTNWVTN